MKSLVSQSFRISLATNNKRGYTFLARASMLYASTGLAKYFKVYGMDSFAVLFYEQTHDRKQPSWRMWTYLANEAFNRSRD